MSTPGGNILRCGILFVLMFSLIACSRNEEARRVAPSRVKISVRTITTKVETFPEFRAFPGQVEPRVRAVLSAKAPGFVKEVMVKEGDGVKAGQNILRLDEKGITSRIEALKRRKKALFLQRQAILKDLSYHEANYRRIKRLFEDEAATQEELDRAKAAFLGTRDRASSLGARIKALDEEIEGLENELTYRVIKSPVDGWVTSRLVDPGTFVPPGARLMEIASQKDGFWLVAELPESFLTAVHQGDTAYFTLKGSQDTVQEGKIDVLVPEVHPVSRTFRVKIGLPEGQYTSGMYGTIWIAAGTRKGILIPEDIIMQRGGIKGVYAVDEAGTIYFQVVTIGGHFTKTPQGIIPAVSSAHARSASPGNVALISTGLSQGMRICASRLMEIKEGMSLE